MKYDILVVGSGPAGYTAAKACANKGFSVALAENSESLGGTGYRWGCLPVKRMLDRLRLSNPSVAGFYPPKDPGMGKPNSSSLRQDSIFSDTDRELELRSLGMEEILKKAGVALFHGNGSFNNPHVFASRDWAIEAESVILATGSEPALPFGLERGEKTGPVLTHKEVLSLPRVPESIIILGASVEGMEFACLFAGLGSRVTVVEKCGEVLPGTDRDLVEPVIRNLKDRGVSFLLGAEVLGIDKAKGVVSLSGGESLSPEYILVTGFRTYSIPPGLREIGIKPEGTIIPTDKNFRTSVPNIYALGDINGKGFTANTAIHQGLIIPRIISGCDTDIDYSAVPGAFFTYPEIAGAGYNETALIEKNIPYTRVVFPLENTEKGFSLGLKTGLSKALFSESGIILGLWMCGPGGAEIASMAGILIKKKATLKDLEDALFVHPSLTEGFLEGIISINS